MAGNQSHILVLFYPVPGHMNPMVQFAKRLAFKGKMVTIVTTTSASKSMQDSQPGSIGSNIHVRLISDGSEHANPESETFEESIKRGEIALTNSLANLIANINSDANEKYPLKFLIYHYSMNWALDVARQQGIDGGPFYTTPAAVKAISYHFYKGVLKFPLEGTVKLPSMPPLELKDLPSFIENVDATPAVLNIAMNQFSNLSQVKWIFHSTFDKLEDEVLQWMTNEMKWAIKSIGPTVPSMFVDKRVNDDKDYGLNLIKPNVDTCMNWLDSKETGSVVYASFGSLANLSKEQIQELALGLNNSNYNFLWVVRESEKQKLPTAFLDEMSTDRRLVVTWCTQLQVLAHKAVGCFLTHCGWNSALEALSLGVPMVGMPHSADHPTVAKYVVDVWKVGVRVKVDATGFVTKEEIDRCIKQVMDADKGKEFRKAALVWKEFAREAVDEGGSSDKNIEDFVSNF